MKLTKFVHACMVVETDDQTILVDPGNFSWQAGVFDIQKLERLDAVVITHVHPDHCAEDFVKAVIQKFPDVPFITTPEAVTQLRQWGVAHAESASIPGIEVFSTKQHASLDPVGQAPENIAVHIAGKLTVGGDRHDLEESKEILALTVTAPWGSMMNAAAMALRLKPKAIVPIHDWHWNADARAGAYATLEAFFKGHDITFHKPVDGQAIQL